MHLFTSLNASDQACTPGLQSKPFQMTGFNTWSFPQHQSFMRYSPRPSYLPWETSRAREWYLPTIHGVRAPHAVTSSQLGSAEAGLLSANAKGTCIHEQASAHGPQANDSAPVIMQPWSGCQQDWLPRQAGRRTWLFMHIYVYTARGQKTPPDQYQLPCASAVYTL